MLRLHNHSKSLRCMLSFGSLALAGSFLSCSPSFEGEYSDPMKEEIVDDRWNETDARTTAEKLIASALGKPWLVDFKVRNKNLAPVVVVDDIENRTDEHIDTQALTNDVQNALINSGKVRFVDAKRRKQILEEIKYQQSGAVRKDSAKREGRQTGADFMLGGELSSNVHTQGQLKTITYQVNLRLTDLETAEVSWSEQHRIKKRFRRSSASW